MRTLLAIIGLAREREVTLTPVKRLYYIFFGEESLRPKVDYTGSIVTTSFQAHAYVSSRRSLSNATYLKVVKNSAALRRRPKFEPLSAHIASRRHNLPCHFRRAVSRVFKSTDYAAIARTEGTPRCREAGSASLTVSRNKARTTCGEHRAEAILNALRANGYFLPESVTRLALRGRTRRCVRQALER